LHPTGEKRKRDFRGGVTCPRTDRQWTLSLHIKYIKGLNYKQRWPGWRPEEGRMLGTVGLQKELLVGNQALKG
jgi:hypothetical protein